MLRFALHLFLICDLLACPLACFGGAPTGGCCGAATRCAPPAASQPNGEGEEDDCDCCNGAVEPKPVDDSPAEPQGPQWPCKSRGACLSDCICKGAVNRPTVQAEELFAGYLVAVLPVSGAVGATEPPSRHHAFDAPQRYSGKLLRAQLMSYLC